MSCLFDLKFHTKIRSMKRVSVCVLYKNDNSTMKERNVINNLRHACLHVNLGGDKNECQLWWNKGCCNSVVASALSQHPESWVLFGSFQERKGELLKMPLHFPIGSRSPYFVLYLTDQQVAVSCFVCVWLCNHTFFKISTQSMWDSYPYQGVAVLIRMVVVWMHVVSLGFATKT